LACRYPTGSIELMIHTIESDGSMRLSISDVNRQKDLINLKFLKLSGNTGWSLNAPSGNFIVRLPEKTISITLPINSQPVFISTDATPYDLTIALWIANFVNRSSIVNTNANINTTTKSVNNFGDNLNSNNAIQNNNKCQINNKLTDADGPPPLNPNLILCNQTDPPSGGGCSNSECCIPHDLVCTFPSSKINVDWPIGPDVLNWGRIETDQVTIQMYGFPCAPNVNIYIGDCCYSHDIGVWCADSDLALLGVNSLFALCVTDAVITALSNAYPCDDGSIGCWFARRAFDLCKLAFSWDLILLETFLFIAMEAFVAADLLTRGDYTNKGEINSASCLCGGNLPTYQCNGDSISGTPPNPASRCRNLCVENGKSENGCYWCTYDCTYDTNGNYSGVGIQSDPDNRLCCCPGSAGTCDFNGTPCEPIPNDFTNHCKNYYPYCYWKCVTKSRFVIGPGGLSGPAALFGSNLTDQVDPNQITEWELINSSNLPCDPVPAKPQFNC